MAKKDRRKEMPYLNLIGEMAKRKISVKNISNLLGIHRNSTTRKLNGEGSFDVEQAFLIQEKYFPDLDLKYLFKKEG